MRLLAALLILMFVAGARAQETQREPQAPPVHTLRVFTNTIQIPTLVLDEAGLPVQEKTHPKFAVTLDGAQPMLVTRARVEGEDPISLAVLLDASGSQAELLHELKWSLPLLVGRGLRAHDRVSIYAMDCGLVKTLNDAPADKETLKLGLENALKSADLHGGKTRGACADKLPLRDTLMVIAKSLKEVPGRRVILAVTNGADTGSKIDWAGAASGMTHFGTTVFGMALLSNNPTRGQPGGTNSRSGPFDPAMDTFCQISGGLMLTANDANVSARLLNMTELLRARYIVEFKRSDELTAGVHPMTIKVPGKNYFIRSGGASMPIADPKLKEDPTVLRLPKVVPAAGPASN